ncbi:element excision factor XisH family protein [Nostoc sp.]|uniref:element excision factor XisH family protein n=1 Tax=Nostoc sp. TaxID=1180 RepID=UPI002FF46064
MSAKNIFHETVKQALEKENWVVTDDPLKLKFGNVNFQIDLGAERVLAAQRAGEKIAVEIKSFLNPSAITNFYAALGQFLSYRLAIEAIEPDRIQFDNINKVSDAEQPVINIAYDPNLSDVYDGLTPTLFSAERTKILWQSVKKAISSGLKKRLN